MTEKQKEVMLNKLNEKIHKPDRDIVDEFISCYLMTDEAAEALLDHVMQQTGLSQEEVCGE